MNVYLVVVQGRPEGARIPLPMANFLIGRDPQCHLRPGSDLVSKMHCAVVQRKEGVFVRDMQSTNGTFVNNDRIQDEVPVKDGDLLKVGPLVFAIKIEAAVPGARKPRKDEEEEAVNWLLDYSAGTAKKVEDLGAKTTVFDARSPASSAQTPTDVPKAEAETKVDTTAAAPGEPPKKRLATAELASDLLEKMLNPQRKKKR